VRALIHYPRRARQPPAFALPGHLIPWGGPAPASIAPLAAPTTLGSGSAGRNRAEPPLHTDDRVDVSPQPADTRRHVRTPIIHFERVLTGSSLAYNAERGTVRTGTGARTSAGPILVRAPARPGSVKRRHHSRNVPGGEASGLAPNGRPPGLGQQRVEVPFALVLHYSVRADREAVRGARAEARKPREDESGCRLRRAARTRGNEDQRQPGTAAHQASTTPAALEHRVTWSYKTRVCISRLSLPNA